MVLPKGLLKTWYKVERPNVKSFAVKGKMWLVGKVCSSVCSCPFINSLLSLQGYLSDLDMQCRMFVQHTLSRVTYFYYLVKLYKIYNRKRFHDITLLQSHH